MRKIDSKSSLSFCINTNDKKEFDIMEKQGKCFTCGGEIDKEIYATYEYRQQFSFNNDEWAQDGDPEELNKHPTIEEVEYFCRGCGQFCEDCDCEATTTTADIGE